MDGRIISMYPAYLLFSLYFIENNVVRLQKAYRQIIFTQMSQRRQSPFHRICHILEYTGIMLPLFDSQSVKILFVLILCPYTAQSNPHMSFFDNGSNRTLNTSIFRNFGQQIHPFRNKWHKLTGMLIDKQVYIYFIRIERRE